MSLEKSKSADKTAWIESLHTKEKAQESFQEAKDFIESVHGIRLTQIELVGLHRITEKVMQEVYKQEKTHVQEKLAGTHQVNSDTNVSYRNEILARFMQEFYSLNPEDIEKLLEESEEDFKEFFRRIQAKAHLL